MVLDSPSALVVLLRVTLLPLPSEVVVSLTVDPSDPFDVLVFTEELDDDESDDVALVDLEDFEGCELDVPLELDVALGACETGALELEALELGAFAAVVSFEAVVFELAEVSFDGSVDVAAVGSALAGVPPGSAADAVVPPVVVAPAVLFPAVASGPSVDSFVVVTSTVEASAERVVVWVVRSFDDGSVRVERVVTAPDDGSTERARVVTTPVEGSVDDPVPSGAVVTCGAA